MKRNEFRICEYKACGFDSRIAVNAVLLMGGTGSRLGNRSKGLLQLGGVPPIACQLVALADVIPTAVAVPRVKIPDGIAGQSNPEIIEATLRQQWLTGITPLALH